MRLRCERAVCLLFAAVQYLDETGGTSVYAMDWMPLWEIAKRRKGTQTEVSVLLSRPGYPNPCITMEVASNGVRKGKRESSGQIVSRICR
jgi:hypothetical protein